MDNPTCTIVRVRWERGYPRWIPVRGPLHSDHDLAFPARHWHVDYRFLRSEKDAANIGSVVGSPAMLRLVVPEPHGVEYLDERDMRWSAEGLCLWRPSCDEEERKKDRLVAMDLRRFPLRSWMRKARWKQRRSVSDYQELKLDRTRAHGANVLVALSRLANKLPGYECLDLEKMRCPHRNVDLSDVEPIDGVIQCPLHGLRFCAKTGERVKSL